MSVTPQPRSTPARRYDLDWLRSAVVLMLIPYHTSRLFDTWEPFYVKNAQTSVALSGARAFLDPWGMPLLFVIAGSATWLALRRRTGIQYLRERLLRLTIPLLFGLVVIVPPQAYLAYLAHGNETSYPEFFVLYWALQTGELMGWDGGFTLGHLWFLVWLFAFSLVALPLFVFLRGRSGDRLIGWVARLSERPGVIFLFFLPFWLTDPLPGPIVGGLNPFSYIFLFIAGFVLFGDEKFQLVLDRSWRPALSLGVCTLAVLVAIRFSGIELPESSWQSSVRDGLLYFTIWALVIGLLGFGHCFLNRPGRVLSYLGAASYPYYVLHQTVIVFFGFYVVHWSIGILPKFLIIGIAALAVTLGLYELARRVSVTRFLMGIKTVTI